MFCFRNQNTCISLIIYKYFVCQYVQKRDTWTNAFSSVFDGDNITNHPSMTHTCIVRRTRDLPNYTNWKWRKITNNVILDKAMSENYLNIHVSTVTRNHSFNIMRWSNTVERDQIYYKGLSGFIGFDQLIILKEWFLMLKIYSCMIQ